MNRDTEIGSPSRKNTSTADSTSLYHLATVASAGRPLCGETSPDAAIGAYVEHLDTSSDAVQWVREVFDRDGKPVKGCAACLALYPTVLL